MHAGNSFIYLERGMSPRIRYILIGSIIVIAIGAVYIGSYVIFRNRHIEVWQQDGEAYVIFPKNRMAVYYLYRPMTYIDANLTGMRFHIGTH